MKLRPTLVADTVSSSAAAEAQTVIVPTPSSPMTVMPDTTTSTTTSSFMDDILAEIDAAMERSAVVEKSHASVPPAAIRTDREVEHSAIRPAASTVTTREPEPQPLPARSERDAAKWPSASDKRGVRQGPRISQAPVPPPDVANQEFTNGCWSRLLWAIGVSDASPQDPGSLTYEPYFGLREKPFGLSPDPRFFFSKSVYGAAFDTLVAGIRRREGILVLTGEVGTGKTTLCRAVLQSLDRKTFAAFLPDPCLSREDLLKKLLVDFGVVPADQMRSGRMRGASRTDLSYPLYEFLASLQPLQAFAVVVIDEAQNLPAETLEEIRILSDLENRQKLLEVMLVGQPELQSRLATSATRQLSQRVSVRCELPPLSADDVRPYVSHRLTIAGGDGRVQFSDAAIEIVFAASGGIPRVINLVCDRALVGAARARTMTVDTDHVLWAVDDLRLPDPRSLRAPTWDELRLDVESAAKEFPKASVEHEPRRHQPPPQDEGLLPAAVPVANRPGDLMRETAQSPLFFSDTPLGSELEETQVIKRSVSAVAPAPKLALGEDLAANRGRRKRLLAVVGALLVLATGFGGYWYSTSQLSLQRSDVLTQPARALLPPQAPPNGPVNLAQTPEGRLTESPNPPANTTDTTISTPAASANVVTPPTLEGALSGSQNPVAGQTAGRFVLQMATFLSPERTARAVQQFRNAGFGAYSMEVSLRSGARALAVFLGPYTDLAAAEQDLARARHIPGYDSGLVIQIGSPAPPPPKHQR